ncbi:helix-turn-helix domain-containing protein [Nonomuraea sp. NPDC050547]|uniref:helix-turn-helix domain-containing protein n=1 Tax=unclassified Nonomuraea TaxID=2593643 RepID=UPI0037AFDB84
MPGDRLTRQDRQAIAAGLAAGLTYSTIAKGLRRPASTVTREILRNGGPAGYRAEQAHQATKQRARRRASARSAPSPAPRPPKPCGTSVSTSPPGWARPGCRR